MANPAAMTRLARYRQSFLIHFEMFRHGGSALRRRSQLFRAAPCRGILATQ